MNKHTSIKPFLILALLIFQSYTAYSCEGELDPEIEALLDQDITSFEAPLPNQQTCFETTSILSFLTPQNSPEDAPPVINLVNILREDIYRKTTGPVTRRSLLDMPALMPDHFSDTCWQVTGDLFFNFSPRVYFTKNSAFLRDYIDLFNEAILREITTSDVIAQLLTADLREILSLFSTLKLQQYRAGLMAGFARQWDNWALRVRIPLYYLLENFFLTQGEIDRIKNNPFFRNDDGGIGRDEDDEVRKFALKHIVSDRIGVGDTRVSALGHLYNTTQKNVWFGLQATLPTAKRFKSALIAGEFDPNATIPPFDLQHFFNVFFCNDNQDLADRVIRTEITDFLISTLDRLSTILINTSLGNGKHFGFGPEFHFRYLFNDCFGMHFYSALEGFTPHRENRYFLVEKTEEDFDRNWRDPATAGVNLALLNRLTVTTLFPVGIRATVHPGIKFQFQNAFTYRTNHVDGKIGFDYWYQGRDRFSAQFAEIPCDLPLVVKKGNRPAAHQGKIFVSVGYCDSFKRMMDWHASINVDGTVFNKGIGQNYTISLRLGLEF